MMTNHKNYHFFLLLSLFLKLTQAQRDGIIRTVTNPPKQYRCENITQIEICREVGWSFGTFPNWREQETQTIANGELEQFRPLIESVCSNAIVHMLCAVYMPFCMPGGRFEHTRLPPCKELCQYVRDGCEDDLNVYGLSWPPHLDCDRYPTKESFSLAFCIDDLEGLTIPANIPTNTPPTTLEPQTGNDTVTITEPPTNNMCPKLSSIPHGNIIGGESMTEGSVVTYKCDDGYELVVNMTCQSNGMWSAIQPSCVVPDRGVYFELRGERYPHNGSVNLTQIGEGRDALLCKTDKTDCCGHPNRAGQFYYPHGVQVQVKKSMHGFYRNRGEKLIRLNRRKGVTSPTGRYTCVIPDSTGSVQSVYINLYV